MKTTKTMHELFFHLKSLQKVDYVLKHCCMSHNWLQNNKRLKQASKWPYGDFPLVFLNRFRLFEGFFFTMLFICLKRLPDYFQSIMWVSCPTITVDLSRLPCCFNIFIWMPLTMFNRQICQQYNHIIGLNMKEVKNKLQN